MRIDLGRSKINPSCEYLKGKVDDQAWIGVDLDGTLAVFTEWKGITSIGDPLPKMVKRVKDWIAKGIQVKILTARVSEPSVKENGTTVAKVSEAIQRWTEKHIGIKLPVVSQKDQHMLFFVDDSCVQIKHNDGDPLAKDGFDVFEDRVKEHSKNEETDDAD